MYARKLKEAAIYSRLREYGRWLTVKTISQVRSILHELAKQNSFNEKENIYFTKIDELSRGEVKESTCLDRKHEYDQYSKFTLPSRLTSLIVKSDNKLLGVSSGTAQGKIMTGDQIDKSSQNDEKVILYTEILSPDLTQYFDEISGIVSTNGGLLSHLAIVAREKRIPVVVGFSLGENDVKIGDNIEGEPVLPQLGTARSNIGGVIKNLITCENVLIRSIIAFETTASNRIKGWQLAILSIFGLDHPSTGSAIGNVKLSVLQVLINIETVPVEAGGKGRRKRVPHLRKRFTGKAHDKIHRCEHFWIRPGAL